jgi:hypothetical protein
MKRGLVEQLYSAREVERLKLPGSMPKKECLTGPATATAQAR